MSEVKAVDVTIANGGTNSTSIQLDEHLLCGIVFPAAFTGATVKVQVSDDNSTFYDLYSAGSVVSISVNTSICERLVPADYAMGKYVRFVSASPEGAERTIKLLIRSEA